MAPRAQPDISPEFNICRYNNGVKLKKPAYFQYDEDHDAYSVADLFKQKFSIYFLNTSSVLTKINAACAMVCGFESESSAIGKSVFDFTTKKSAALAVNSDKEIIMTEKAKIFDQLLTHIAGQEYQYLTIKLPWYSDNNSMRGVLGFSIALGVHPLADSISNIVKLGLLKDIPNIYRNKSAIPTANITSCHLSNREIDCLCLTVRGKSAKQVGYELNISARTVEEHLNNIKRKMSVFSKAELIQKTIDHYSHLIVKE